MSSVEASTPGGQGPTRRTEEATGRAPGVARKPPKAVPRGRGARLQRRARCVRLHRAVHAGNSRRSWRPSATAQAIKEILPRYADQADDLTEALRGLVAARAAMVAGLEKRSSGARPTRSTSCGPGPSWPRRRCARPRGAVSPLHVLADDPRRAGEPRSRRRFARGPAQGLARTTKPSSFPAEDVQQLRSELFAESEGNTLETQYQQVRREYEQLRNAADSCRSRRPAWVTGRENRESRSTG